MVVEYKVKYNVWFEVVHDTDYCDCGNTGDVEVIQSFEIVEDAVLFREALPKDEPTRIVVEYKEI